jgi:tetratricopeptide (TPR) repeat protein
MNIRFGNFKMILIAVVCASLFLTGGSFAKTKAYKQTGRAWQHIQKAVQFNLEGNNAYAIAELKWASMYAIRDPFVPFALAYLHHYASEGEPEAALRYANLSLEIDATNMEALYLRAVIHEREGLTDMKLKNNALAKKHFELASRDLKQALPLLGTKQDAHNYRVQWKTKGLLYDRVDGDDGGLSVDEFRIPMPSKASLLLQQGMCWLHSAENLKQYRKLNKKKAKIKYQNFLQEALQQFEHVIQLSAKNRQALFHKAQVLDKLGSFKQAEKAYSVFLKTPGNEYASEENTAEKRLKELK